MIRLLAFVTGLCLFAATAQAQDETPPAPMPDAAADGEDASSNGKADDEKEAIQAPQPYVANYGANYFYPYYAYAPNYYMTAYTPGYIYPAFSYTPISPIAYPVYGYYPYYYGAYAAPYYGVGYSYRYVPYATYGGYYTWYGAYPATGWYAGYGTPIYMGW